MKFLQFIRTYEGTQAENRWLRLFVGGLVILTLLLALKSFSKETIVVVQPATLEDEAWVMKNQSSQSYQEAWGLFLANLLGNTTPSNVDFLKEKIGPLLSPVIFNEVMEVMQVQANQIKADRVTMRFEPRFVIYEGSNNRVYVQGQSFIQGVTGLEERSDRTYEFEIAISRFMPQVTYINTYEGKPRTTRVREQIERREEARKNRENQ